MKDKQTFVIEFFLAETAFAMTTTKTIIFPSKIKRFINKLYILYITYI
jgi:hypothetical protein